MSRELTDAETAYLRAQEYRAIADCEMAPKARASYLDLAAFYEQRAGIRVTRLAASRVTCEAHARACEEFAKGFTAPETNTAILEIAAQWRKLAGRTD